MRNLTKACSLLISALVFFAACSTGKQKKVNTMSDDELLTLVQKQTFKYFYDFAHPANGMARERSNDHARNNEMITSGGSGFGIMSLIVGAERGFITRDQAVSRMDTILNFLETGADRFHGVYPHWWTGSDGKAYSFSEKDNGGDLVETSFLMQGLLTFHQYMKENIEHEAAIRARIDKLWREVEWNWHTKGGEKVLYWHWSPQYGWEMNHTIRGFNECLITYVLAAASPTYPVDADVYHQGWAVSDHMKNRNEYFGIKLPLGFEYGGPLFFSHYSFLGLDPRGLEDRYANYWEQNVAHTKINRQYCIENPKKWKGYSEKCWGLTASDNHQGYSAHDPMNDLGVITPTAALSAFPYAPEYSMQALKYFYNELGNKLWGDYGFKDAFNLTENWFAESYLAIDQGPIVVMIENYRTGLLWDLFMSHPDVRKGLIKLDFTSPKFKAE